MEHGILHIPVDGVDVDFYPETSFDDVLDTGSEITLTKTLANMNEVINSKVSIAAYESKVASLEADIASKAPQSNTYTKAEVNTAVNAKADKATTYTKSEVDSIAAGKADQATTYTKTEVNTLAGGKIDKNQGTENKGKVLQVGDNGQVILSSGGGHQIVDEVPSAEQAEDNVVYFVEGAVGAGSVNVEQLATNVALLQATSQIVESGDNYIRWANGLQICWGTTSSLTVNSTAAIGTGTINIMPFKDTEYTLQVVSRFVSGEWKSHTVTYNIYSSNAFEMFISNSAGNYTTRMSYIAIGWWK